MNVINVGQVVTFDARTRGVKTGTVIKVNPKTAQVAVNGEGNWKVSKTLLQSGGIENFVSPKRGYAPTPGSTHVITLRGVREKVTVLRNGPKRAVVATKSGDQWRVPFSRFS